MRFFGSLMHDGWRIASLVNEGPVTLFAVKSPDGKRKLLVTDFRGAELELKIKVDGAGDVKHVTASVIDNTRDDVSIPVDWRDGVITLVKPENESSVWMIDFDAPANTNHMTTANVRDSNG